MPARPAATDRIQIDDMYVAQTASFDGSNDYFETNFGTFPSGATDATAFTLSVWFRHTATSLDGIFYNHGNRLTVSAQSDDTIIISTKDSSNVASATLRTVTVFDDSAWHHLIISINYSAQIYSCYVDGVTETLTETIPITNTNVELTRTTYTVGAATGGTNHWIGGLAEIYLVQEYIDLSVAANLAKFINADDQPVDLGSDGSTPTGNAPLFYFNKNGNLFGTDQSGRSNDLTHNGAVVPDTSSPSD